MTSANEPEEAGAVQIRLVGPEKAVLAAARALEGLVHGVADADGYVHMLVITEPHKGRKGEWLAYGTYDAMEGKGEGSHV